MTDRFKNEEGNRQIWPVLIGVISVFVILTGLAVFLLHASKTCDEFDYELGDRIDLNLESYLNAGPLAYKLAKPDFSDIDALAPGEYDVHIDYFFRTYDYTINIEDTTAPVIVPAKDLLYFVEGSCITPSEMIKNIKDADRDITVVFDPETGNDRLDLKESGSFTATLYAFDSSGNSSRCDVEYVVDTPPVMGEIKDIYLTTNATGSLLSLARATDEMDGDLTGDITVSKDLPDLIHETGETSVTFSVTDSCGFTTEVTVPVYVDDPASIQQLIGDSEISRFDSNILGAMNVYDCGIRDYDDISEAVADRLNTIVNVRIYERNGAITTGSGFIAEIAMDKVWIITNRHVVNENEEAEITFYGGETVNGEIIGYSEGYDVAVITVKLSDLPEDFDSQISTVHIDMPYWDKLDEEIVLGLAKLDNNGNVDHTSSGVLIERYQGFDYFNPHIQTEMALILARGDSGSAVFDKNGRLICMAFAYSIAPERDWAVPLNEIVESYEEITGRELYTY